MTMCSMRTQPNNSSGSSAGAAPCNRNAMSATTTGARPIASPIVYWAILEEAMLQSVSK